MARGLCGGMVLAVAALLTEPGVGAAPLPIHRGGDVRFAVGQEAGESTLTAEGMGVRISKRVGPERVRIRVETKGDMVDLETDAMLRVKVSRRGKSVVLQMKARDPKRVDEVRRLIESSPALGALDALIERIKKDERDVARSVMTSWALFHAVRGSDVPAMDLARRLAPAAATSFFKRASATVAGEIPVACWMEYANSLNIYMTEYIQCYTDWGWVPGMNAACTFEWLVKVELAWFWVITCSGGIPI